MAQIVDWYFATIFSKAFLSPASEACSSYISFDISIFLTDKSCLPFCSVIKRNTTVAKVSEKVFCAVFAMICGFLFGVQDLQSGWQCAHGVVVWWVSVRQCGGRDREIGVQGVPHGMGAILSR